MPVIFLVAKPDLFKNTVMYCKFSRARQWNSSTTEPLCDGQQLTARCQESTSAQQTTASETLLQQLSDLRFYVSPQIKYLLPKFVIHVFTYLQYIVYISPTRSFKLHLKHTFLLVLRFWNIHPRSQLTWKNIMHCKFFYITKVVSFL